MWGSTPQEHDRNDLDELQASQERIAQIDQFVELIRRIGKFRPEVFRVVHHVPVPQGNPVNE